MNRNDFKTELIVGVFGILALGIIVFMSREVSDTPVSAKNGVVYYAHFDSVAGLIPKTPVEIAGIQVGYVEAIQLENQYAKLTLRLDSEVSIFVDAQASIVNRGILGNKLVSINPGTFGKQKLAEGQVISVSGGGGDLDALFATFQKTSENINRLAENLNKFVESQYNSGNLDAIVENLVEMTDNLNRFVQHNTTNLETLLANFRDISVSLKHFVDSNVSVELAQTTESLNNTMASLERIAKDLEDGRGTVGKLLRDETTINKINSAIDNIEDVTGGINRLRTDVRYRGEYLMESGDLQNLIALTIRPRPDKFFRVELIDAPEGDTRVTNTQVLDAAGNPLSTTQTIETSDRVLFSVEMAKTFYDATVRFGIIRNEGGIGFDYTLFEKMITLSVEAFNFGRFENNFQLRAYGTVNLWKYIMLTAGVDDFLDETGPVDPFVGAGISFRDDDIKSLFGAISFSNFGS